MKKFSPPKHLDYIARKQWLKYAKHLREKESVQEQDLHNLEVFCVNYSVYYQAYEQIKQHGLLVLDNNGNLKKNPAVIAKNDAEKLLFKCGSLLGLDPVSRSRMPEEDQLDLLDELVE